MKKIRITSSDKLRLVSVILSLVMVFVMIPKGIVRADSGNCGPGLSWDFNGGVLTISGSGDMYGDAARLHPYPFRDRYSVSASRHSRMTERSAA